MAEVRTEHVPWTDRRDDGLVHFIDWLNHKLMGPIGPPPLGPYDTVVRQIADATCPICGRPMREHSIDRSTPNAVIDCPGEHLPVVDDHPLNELGMDHRP